MNASAIGHCTIFHASVAAPLRPVAPPVQLAMLLPNSTTTNATRTNAAIAIVSHTAVNLRDINDRDSLTWYAVFSASMMADMPAEADQSAAMIPNESFPPPLDFSVSPRNRWMMADASGGKALVSDCVR